jgi:hypothetical protein
MAGARKKVYDTFHTGGRGNVDHGGETGGVGPHIPNQMTPGHHPVPRHPEDAGQFDENFAHKTGEGEKD